MRAGRPLSSGKLSPVEEGRPALSVEEERPALLAEGGRLALLAEGGRPALHQSRGKDYQNQIPHQLNAAQPPLLFSAPIACK